jgi:hypothetical protein
MLAFPNIIHCIPPLKKHILSTDSIVVLPALLLISLLLLALPVALLGLEVFLPQLTRRVAVKVGEDDFEDVRVPCYGLAFDAFFDVLS